MKEAKWIWVDGEEKRDQYARFYRSFEAHGGKIEAKNNKEGGASFEFSLEEKL